jgi:two-component system NtrC family sensor kinase
VWLNLLLNARDAVKATGGEIRLATRRTDTHIVVTVADSGIGISAERVSRIFEPFYTTKAPGQGTGLGLSVCHQIIKQHGGEIRVTSALGQGTTFAVSLPLTPQPAL